MALPRYNKYNETYQLLETGVHRISPHLSWAIRNAAINHCGVALNLIAYHEDLPTNNYGEAVPILQGFAINLSKHFYAAVDCVMEEENMWISLRALIIRELLDTTFHEAHHLKAANTAKVYDNPDIENKEATDIGRSKAWEFAKRWDVEITEFGPVIDTLLKDFIQSLREDIKEKMVMWKAIQIHMWDNNLGYFDGDNGVELDIRKTFEAHTKNEAGYAPWTEEPMKFKGDAEVIEKTASIETIAETISTTPVAPKPPEPVYQQEPVHTTTPVIHTAPIQTMTSVPSTFMGDDLYDIPQQQFDEDPFEQYTGTVAAITPITQIPRQQTAATPAVNNNLTSEEMATCAEHVIRMLFWHIINKCEFNSEGRYNNPGAVLEPISLAHIPHATEMFTHYNTTNAQGGFVGDVPCNGIIKGIVTGQGLPSYQLYFTFNSVKHLRTLLPVNSGKTDGSGNLTTWAQQARDGYKRVMWLEKDQGMRATIELSPEAMLGQEEYKIIPKKKQK